MTKKGIKMHINRRNFIGSSVATMAVGLSCPAYAGEKPLLKVGFMTDTHVGTTKKSCERVKGAFEVFKAQGVDAVGHCGDLADWHYVEGYKYYRETFEDVYPEGTKRPELLYVYANHDALDPTKKDPKLRQQRVMDLATAFADMRARLKIDHGLFHQTTLGGIPFLVFPQTQKLIGGYEEVEKQVAAACAAHPTGPVVVLTHMAPAHTAYNSGEWGDAALRRIFSKYPRVVTFTGHTHGSLRNEQSVWQGEFTAVDVCCLQEWHGISVGTPVAGKQAYGVVVAEFFANRIVLRRFDVRDGSEFKPEDPWVVTLPFAAATAPLNWETRAKTEPKAAFAAGSQMTFTTDAVPFGSLKVSFPGAQAEEDVLSYRIEISRRKNGAWERFARNDVFGEFYLRPADRTGRYARSYPAIFFEADETYRFTVTPVGFFGALGTPLEGEWTAPAKKPSKTILLVEDPMDKLICRQGWPRSAQERQTAKPSRRDPEGWYLRDGGLNWFEMPEGVWQTKKGTHCRVAADLRVQQAPKIDGWCLRLSTADGTSRSACGWMTTPDGDAGLLRCVFEFDARVDDQPNFALQLDRGGKGRFRLERLAIEND